MSEVMAQDNTATFEKKTRLIYSLNLCLRLTSPNYAFMRHRLYSKRKVKEYLLYICNRIRVRGYKTVSMLNSAECS